MEDSRLGNLLSYTTFHVGIYISLVTAFIGAGIFGKLDHPVLHWAVGCFLVAGMCGGVVASNITAHRNMDEFSAAEHGSWLFKRIRYNYWTFIEHLAFWLGILPVAFLFIWSGATAIKSYSGTSPPWIGTLPMGVLVLFLLVRAPALGIEV
jgi:hypothetical protein